MAAAAAGFGSHWDSCDSEDGQPAFACPRRRHVRWTERDLLQNHWKSMDMHERHPLEPGAHAWVTNAETVEHVRVSKRKCELVNRHGN